MKNQYYKSTHDRDFDKFKYVYPVISRRSGGLSLGINLNPDKVCNFGCIYCQVNRNQMSKHVVDLQALESELTIMLEMLQDKTLFSHSRFKDTDEDQLVFKDIGIAGDGEPSVSKYLLETMQIVQKLMKSYEIPKVVIISNSTGFAREKTIKALDILAEIDGEIWAKLDAGTQEYFELISQHTIKVEKIVQNIQRVNPSISIQIQTCFMKVHQEMPKDSEILEYKKRVEEILKVREIAKVQIYTVAREPAESYVDAISLVDLKTLCEPLSQMNVKIDFYGGSAN
ncbi:radical SAM protein [bacterium]|nr:radical SAM protein [bacterium]